MGLGAMRKAGGLAVCIGMSTLAFAVSASAATPELLFRAPSDGKSGSGAGAFSVPRDVVGDPSTGHLYVSEAGNERISEYTAWGLFVKAWGWGVADGASELQTCGPVEPVVEPDPSLCGEGIQGEGKGQFNDPIGITRDGAGNIFVAEFTNLRVQKFSPDGEFLLMFGGKVNQTKVAEGAPAAEQNVCPITATDVCQAGTPGTAPSHFLVTTAGNYIDYSPTADAILVGGKDRIQIFNLDGTFREEIPFEGPLALFDEKSVFGLDVDADGNIYVTIEGLEDVYKLSPSGQPLDPGKPDSSKFAAVEPQGAVTVDGAGNVYVVDDRIFDESRVLAFDTAGNKLLPTKEEEEENEFFPYISFRGPILSGLTTNGCGGPSTEDLYLTAFGQGNYLESYGPPPVACEDPPEVPPSILQQYATTVRTESATVRAQINPHFWSDTTYSVEYGTGECAAGGCPNSAPLTAAQLTDKVVNKAITSRGVFLSGLAPGTTYHYRFVAQSGGGGPVFGIDPDGNGPEKASLEDGLEGTFTTFRAPTSNPPCANDQFRVGPGSELPDCRAYEMVSPIDKSNGDAALLPSTLIFHELNQSSTSGERFTYPSFTPFAGPESAPYISQYLASRDPSTGWSNDSISPPRSTRPLDLQFTVNNEFKAFSADLCMGWLRHNSTMPLTADAVAGFPNLYRRDNCSEPPSYEALTTAEPRDRPADRLRLYPVGFTEDGQESLFLSNGALTDDAPELPNVGFEEAELQLYLHGPKGLRFLCRLPSGTPYGFACAAGMAAGQPDGKASALKNAISADGSRVFWTAYKGDLENAPIGIPGRVFVRLNPEEEQSTVEGGECTEPELACTLPISDTVSPEPAEFWGASDDGSKVIFKFANQGSKDFAVENNLYEFDVDSGTPRLIAGGVEGPMGQSEDASRIYFSSSKVLGDGGSEGAKEGAHNLYLYEAPEEEGEEGRFDFIMALGAIDLVGSEGLPSAVNEVPTERSSAISTDGLHAAFVSAVNPTPTGFDNSDVETGQPVDQVYLYDAEAEELRCVSCNPTNARPAGDPKIGAAARLPAPKVPLGIPRPLAENGDRLFFDSHEALVPGDNNGTWDVYEWEAPGTGSCDEGDSTFGVDAGGCVELISSGESTADSRFLDADPSGTNVFIGTQSSLIASDPSSNDVYDVRIGGGFPLPIGKSSCEGGACQSPPPPPAGVTPASEAFDGAGNLPRTKKRCKRGTHKVHRKGKVRCVKNHKRKGKKGHHKRRAAK
jgi:hypothetical protein